jgi:hypothetical protein
VVLGFELVLARQVLYHFSHAPSPSVIFQIGSCALSRGGEEGSDGNLSTYMASLAGIIDVLYHPGLLCDGVSVTFFQAGFRL